MLDREREFLEFIKNGIKYKKKALNWSNRRVATWLDGFLCGLSDDYSEEFIGEVYQLKNYYLEIKY